MKIQLRGHSVRVHWIVLTLMLLGSAVNVWQFKGIQKRAYAGYRALQRDADDRWFAVARSYGICKQRYALAWALRDNAPNAIVYVPKEGGIPSLDTLSQLVAFGAVSKVVRRDYDPTAWGRKLSLVKHRVAKTADGPRLRYIKRDFVLLAKPQRTRKHSKHPRRDSPREFVMLSRGKTDVVVDIALVERPLRKILR